MTCCCVIAGRAVALRLLQQTLAAQQMVTSPYLSWPKQVTEHVHMSKLVTTRKATSSEYEQLWRKQGAALNMQRLLTV